MEDYKKTGIKVEFTECEVGWLYLTVSDGKRDIELHFSHCFDPLPDLKIWLEAIALGVEQTSFSYNPEGNIIKFDFLETTYSVKLSEGTEKPEVFDTKPIDVFSLSIPFFGNDKIFAHDNASLELLMAEKPIPNEQDEIFFKAWVDRKQLIEAFYNAVLDFEKSDKYNKNEWEREHWNGMPLSNFRSEFIEKYLKGV